MWDAGFGYISSIAKCPRLSTQGVLGGESGWLDAVVTYPHLLAEGAHVHDVFHVGLLKPFHGTPSIASTAVTPMENHRFLPCQNVVLHARLRR